MGARKSLPQTNHGSSQRIPMTRCRRGGRPSHSCVGDFPDTSPHSFHGIPIPDSQAGRLTAWQRQGPDPPEHFTKQLTGALEVSAADFLKITYPSFVFSTNITPLFDG